MDRLRAVWLVAAVGAVAIWAGGCSDTDSKLSSEDPTDRMEALRRLAASNSDKAVAKIVEATEHADPGTAREAVWALARSGRARAQEALAEVAGGAKRPKVREAAVMALGEQHTPASVEALRKVLRSERDGHVRAEAAAALGKVGDLDDVALLVDVASSADSVGVESAAVGSIQRLLTVDFQYQASDPVEKRRETLDRIRQQAPGFVAFMKRVRATRERLAAEGRTDVH